MTTLFPWRRTAIAIALANALSFLAPIVTACAQTAPSEPAPPPGAVIFSRSQSLDPNDPTTVPNSDSPQPAAIAKPAESKTLAPGDSDSLQVTDAERTALTFTAYDLDVHLTPATAGISARAALIIRNDSAAPLTRLVLQITSTMHWDSFSNAPSPHLQFQARRIATDGDHTGWAEEAVVTLPQPLAPGASVSLTALYSGAIPPSSERLERIGAPPSEAAAADWDAVAAGNPLAYTTASLHDTSPDGTGLRGFGNVLWYPVASPPLFLGDGAKLFDAIGRTKLREQAATVRLRLAVEFTGDGPDAAFFCGRREQLSGIHDNPDLPIAESPGIATAVFDTHPLGFRTPSLFITSHPSTPAGTPSNENLIAAVTDNYDAVPAYSAAAALVEPMLTDWFGPHPLTTLNLIDHPGQPFEDDALLVRPVAVEPPNILAPSLAHSLTHVWIRSSRPWIDEGLAQFAGLLWIERTKGRAAALDQLQEAARTLALAEPAANSPTAGEATPTLAGLSASSGSSPSIESGPAGQSLITATSEIYYRAKAAAVWWMLRNITSDDALKQALQAYRLDPKLDRDPVGLQRTLERFSHKDLNWFFDNWVYEDRGLPDLSIVNVTPRQLEARSGLPAGWLVSVEVRNDGDAEAEVPITVRSAPGLSAGASAATETQTLRIAGHSSISRRIVFASTPAEVQVNDGSVPETRTSVHTRQLTLPVR
jgi:hypothetical protein